MHPYGQGYGMPMPPRRAGAPKDMGTLSIIFGAIVFALSLVNLATGGKFGMFTKVDASQQAAFDRYLAEVHSAAVALGLMMLVMATALFVIGFGQKGYKRWARKASI